MSTPAKNIPTGYKQTEIGTIPVDWDVKRLGDIGESLIGLTYKPSDVSHEGVLVLRSSNIQNDKLAFEDNVYVNVDIPEKIRVKNGDILICVRNGSRNLIGKCALLDSRVEGQTFGAFMAVFRTVYYQFVFRQFKSDNIQRQINENIGATINQITNKNLNSFRIAFPSKEEERSAIGIVLSDVNALIEKLDTLLEKKKNIKQGAMQELLTGKRRLPGFSGEWKMKRLGDFFDYEQPTKYLVKSTDYSDSYNIPVLTAGKTFILGYTAEETGLFQKLPTIIFDDFTTAIKYVDFPFKAKSSAMKMLVPRSKDVNLKFVFAKMQLIDFELGDHKRHWISEYQNIEIETPESDEQTAIASVLSDMDMEIESLEFQLTKYQNLKQGMMQVLLTGKIRLI